MSVRIMAEVWALPDLHSTDKLVLLALADWSNDDGVCWPSMAQLAVKCGLTDRAVRAAISRMKERYLTRDERPGKGVTYTVHPAGSDAKTPERRSAPPRNNIPPERRSPRNDIPRTPERRSANTSITTNTSLQTSSSERSARASSAKPNPFPKPEWADCEVWRDFVGNRRRKRLGTSATAHAKLLRDIEKLTDDDWPPGRILEAITAKGWGAIYPSIKDDDDDGGNGGKPHRMAGNHRQSSRHGVTIDAALAFVADDAIT